MTRSALVLPVPPHAPLHVSSCRTSPCTPLALQPAVPTEGHVWSGRGRERHGKLDHLLLFFFTLESGPEVGTAAAVHMIHGLAMFR